MPSSFYTTLFLDVGGVFLTNGWDHHMRERAAQQFNLDLVELDKRHALTFDTYEIGKITLDVYLNRVVFYTDRSFSREEFKEFMFAQSQPYPDMIQLIRDLKARYSLRTVVVSNEGRELMLNRINHFKMKEFIDFFVCSCFIGYRKPDTEVYRLALDMAQVKPQEVIYVDDRPMLAEIGGQLGMQAIQHKSYEQTKTLLNDFLSVTPSQKG
jgi:putative hydrolase of the HAD superfamily